jgi:hypothetical protein
MKSDIRRSKAALPAEAVLLDDLRHLIDEARSAVAVAVNAGLTMLYWHVGKRINDEILGGERAGYGKEIVATLSRQLAAKYGNSFSEKNLRRMIQFAEVFPDEQIVVSLIRQLSWTHRSVELSRLHEGLMRIMTTESIPQWLDTPNPAFSSM